MCVIVQRSATDIKWYGFTSMSTVPTFSYFWKLFIASHCHRSLYHPTSSQFISCLLSFSPHLTSSHFMFSLPFPTLLNLKQLFSSLLMSFEFFCFLSSQFLSIFSNFHRHSQPFSTLRSSCQFMFFSHFLSSSCQLVTPHVSSSQRALNHLGAKANDPYVFHWKDLTQKSLHTASFCTEKLANPNLGKFLLKEISHTASFHTETLHRELFSRSKLSHTGNFYTLKFLHPEVFTQRSFCTENPLHSDVFTHNEFLHTEVFTQRNFYTLAQNHLCEF